MAQENERIHLLKVRMISTAVTPLETWCGLQLVQYGNLFRRKNGGKRTMTRATNHMTLVKCPKCMEAFTRASPI